MIGRILTAIVIAVSTLTSCIHEFPSEDCSLNFCGVVVNDHESGQKMLILTCKKHSGAETYHVTFHVDGEDNFTLEDEDGHIHSRWLSDSFTQGQSHSYLISPSYEGKHLLRLTISTKDFCQSMEIPYEARSRVRRRPH